jgi:hypothetical protein
MKTTRFELVVRGLNSIHEILGSILIGNIVNNKISVNSYMSKSSYVGSKVGVKKEKLAIIPLQGRILNSRDQNPSKIR